MIILGHFIESGDGVKIINESIIFEDSTLMSPDPDLSSIGLKLVLGSVSTHVGLSIMTIVTSGLI